MRPRFADIAFHLARLAGSLLVLALAARLASVPGMVLGAVLFFLEAFALTHDLTHGALGLPRRANEIALAVAGALLLMSGHAVRRTHLAHHSRTFGRDDLEGAFARLPLLRALLGGPAGVVALRARAFRGAGPRGQRWQLAETAADLALLVALVASGRPAGLVYAAVAVLAQLTMGVWASYIPHNAPAWVVRVAARLDWTGSPTVLSLAYHELHHARPEVPCRRLGAAARAAA
jgi:fatty acid desaturase